MFTQANQSTYVKMHVMMTGSKIYFYGKTAYAFLFYYGEELAYYGFLLFLPSVSTNLIYCFKSEGRIQFNVRVRRKPVKTKQDYWESDY